VKLYGENGFITNQSSNSQPMLASSMPEAPTYFGDMTDAKNNTELFWGEKTLGMLAIPQYAEETKHHQPIAVGLQIGWGLTSRLRLTTGVVYTRTTSDFISKTTTYQTVTTQRLHYVGIPLNLSYQVWGTERFHTYLTVGGEGAFNVKNQTDIDGQDVERRKDRMQWSGQTAIGAQYDIVPQLGIYVEPGAKYYFDNGSQVENIFKEKKLNFNFQFGLRLNLDK